MGVYCLIDRYIFPDDTEEWLPCPNCGLKPKIWEYDNGRSTGCGCGEDMFDHFSVFAESIMSVYRRTNGTKEYHTNDLKNNWNHWVKTGEHIFKPCDGMW